VAGELWPAVDRLVDRAASLEDLRRHRIHLLAAHGWRARGVEVSQELVLDELLSHVRIRGAHRLLGVLRDAYDGPVMMLKGLEIASHYPSPDLRVVNDLDVLVEDADGAYAACVAAGLMPVGYEDRYYTGQHHLRPLVHPDDLSLVLEIHRRPNWVPWALAPSAPELIAGGVPSRLGLPGLLAPPPEQHAVMTAVHSFNDAPLRRLGDFVDVLALIGDVPASAAEEVAAGWGVDRLWRSTLRVARAVLLDGPQPWWLPRFASDLLEVRDRTVLENHLRTWMGPVIALPPRGAVVELGHALHSELWPREGETWGDRGRRVVGAVRHVNRANAEHQHLMGERPAAE
jgi:hypothetical protein